MGCFASDTVVIDTSCMSNTLSIEKKIKELSFSVYPNPANEYINIKFQKNTFNSHQIRIMDASGRIVMNETINNGDSKLDVANLSKEIYLILIESNSKNNFKPVRFIKL